MHAEGKFNKYDRIDCKCHIQDYSACVADPLLSLLMYTFRPTKFASCESNTVVVWRKDFPVALFRKVFTRHRASKSAILCEIPSTVTLPKPASNLQRDLMERLKKAIIPLDLKVAMLHQFWDESWLTSSLLYDNILTTYSYVAASILTSSYESHTPCRRWSLTQYEITSRRSRSKEGSVEVTSKMRIRGFIPDLAPGTESKVYVESRKRVRWFWYLTDLVGWYRSWYAQANSDEQSRRTANPPNIPAICY